MPSSVSRRRQIVFPNAFESGLVPTAIAGDDSSSRRVFTSGGMWHRFLTNSRFYPMVFLCICICLCKITKTTFEAGLVPTIAGDDSSRRLFPPDMICIFVCVSICFCVGICNVMQKN